MLHTYCSKTESDSIIYLNVALGSFHIHQAESALTENKQAPPLKTKTPTTTLRQRKEKRTQVQKKKATLRQRKKKRSQVQKKKRRLKILVQQLFEKTLSLCFLFLGT
jgi:hypothetical protein